MNTPSIRRCSVLTAFVGIAVAHMMHAHGEPFSASTLHWLTDSILALPLSIAAMLAGRRAASALRANAALTQATLFALALVPGSAVHSHLDRTHGSFSLLHAFSDASKVFFVVAPLLLLLHARIRGARRYSPAVAPITIAATLLVPLQARVPAVAIPPGYAPFQLPMFVPPVLSGSAITLHARESFVQVAPGATTKMWTYCEDTVGCSFPGPTIRRTSANPTTVTLCNDLPAADGELTMHLHGNHSTPENDGQPASLLVSNGACHRYDYSLTENGSGQEHAAFRWYHDHRMMQTARNVFMGLAGMWILDDAIDNPASSLNLPSGSYDVPMMIASRSLDSNNQISYVPSGTGTIGQLDLVNGVAQPYFNVEARKYRLRLLNADNNEPFLFAFSDGRHFQQIATESGLLPAPIDRTSITLGPAERGEIVVDFAGSQGSSIELVDLGWSGGPKHNVMQFKVGPVGSPDTSSVPPVLRYVASSPGLVAPVTTRLWILGQEQVNPYAWTINGQVYDPSRVDATPKIGSTERWIFVNTTFANHYMHMHDVDWRMVQRISADASDPADASVEQHGFKETFLVRPQEILIVQATFTDNLGTYVFHCHVLEHEDQAMMAQFRVDG